ncbi:MAG: hypothetical protein ACRDNS_14785 [Trebonia sp.]
MRSLVSLIGSLTEPGSLGAQHVVMNGRRHPDARSTWYCSWCRSRARAGAALLRGAGLAALIGGSGLGLYYLAFKAGMSLPTR